MSEINTNYKEIELNKIYKLKGFSRGAFRTGFVLLPHKIFLDAGLNFNITANIIFITHTHQDHINNLYSLLSDGIKIPVVSTNNSLKLLSKYLESNYSLNCGQEKKFYNWSPVLLGKNFDYKINNVLFRIETIFLDHEIETVGYGFSEVKKKLKECYLDKTTEEIIELKKTEEILEIKLLPIIFFCGDTSYKSLPLLPFENYPYFIIECTFLFPEHLNDARNKKHLHIDDLIPCIEKYTNTTFILIHFSCRYSKNEVKEYRDKYDYKNIIFWI
jgi:ribonuclease Z